MNLSKQGGREARFSGLLDIFLKNLDKYGRIYYRFKKKIGIKSIYNTGVYYTKHPQCASPKYRIIGNNFKLVFKIVYTRAKSSYICTLYIYLYAKGLNNKYFRLVIFLLSYILRTRLSLVYNNRSISKYQYGIFSKLYAYLFLITSFIRYIYIYI